MTRLADIFREDAQYVQGQFEAQRRVAASDEYMRKLRYQMFHDRYAVADELAATRNGVTGY